MLSPLPRAPAERLALILDLLCRAVAARGPKGLIAVPLAFLIWGRLRRLGIRFTRLVARIAAGEAPPPPRQRAPRTPAPRPAPRPAAGLPRGRAWLRRLLLPEGPAAGSQLQHLLADAEMAALIAADRRVGRLLRPLCHMLGVTPPHAPARPPRQPPPDAAPHPAATHPGATHPAEDSAPRAASPPGAPAAAPSPFPNACGPPCPA